MAYTTINKSTAHFNTKLYTGDGNTSKAITGVGFQPDLVWIRNRPDARDHHWYDAVRGTNKVIGSDRTAAEATVTNGVTAFGTDGFTVGNDANVNDNGDSHVAWCWKANGAGSSNTDGSITSTVSANTTAGFSIVKYQGAGGNSTGTTSTVGHGLGAKPKMIIIKSTSNAWKWVVYHEDVTPNNSHLQLNTNDAIGTSSYNYWNTPHTTTTFGLGEQSDTNGNGIDFIAYCFAEKTGYSKFGKFTGNGSTNGPFIYTGFKPSFVIAKESSSTGHWRMRDNKRMTTGNPIDKLLRPDQATAEQTEDNVDFLSNGFKMRTTGGENNGSGDTYIYAAFGQSLVGSNNVPCTAR